MSRHAPGEQIGDFRLQSLIAHGGSGQVWRAESSSVEQSTTSESSLVALKAFDRVDEAGIEVARLSQGAGIDGLVELLDHGPGWLAARWVEGETLAYVLENQAPVSLTHALFLLRQVASTLDQLHERGIVHGDVSPSNVIVDADGHTTLVDLGSALTDAQSSGRTARIEVVATPRYAAPEVAAGSDAGPSADRYALALIAYEALSAQSPFPAVTTPIAFLGHHLSTPPAPLSESAPRFGERVDAVFERALAKDPGERFSRALDFVDALAAAGAAPNTNGAAADDLNPQLQPKRGRGFRWLLAGAAAIVFVIGGLAVINGADDDADLADPGVLHGPITAVLDPQGQAVQFSAGTAAGATCNLVLVPGFEQDAPIENWYQDGVLSVDIVPGAGVGGTAAMRVGAAGQYGLLGERVAVEPGRQYVMSAWVRRQGAPDDSGMWVEFEDADNVHLDEYDEQRFAPESDFPLQDGRRVQVMVQVPSNAAFAIPSFFKDSSNGALLVDEVVFGPAETCTDLQS